MNLQKEIQPKKRINYEKFAASIWQNWLKNLLLRILSCQFYERVLFCIQDTLKGANIVLISHEQSSNRVLSHIFLPEYAIFLQRFICHIFIFHVCPYAAFLIFTLYLLLSCLLLHCLSLHILRHFCFQFLYIR